MEATLQTAHLSFLFGIKYYRTIMHNIPTYINISDVYNIRAMTQGTYKMSDSRMHSMHDQTERRQRNRQECIDIPLKLLILEHK